MPSPRNSKEAFTSLLADCGATKLITTATPPPTVPMILKSYSLTLFTIPSLEDVLDDTPVPDIQLDADWADYRFRPFVQIHTSGSTGIPKLITLRHGNFTALDAYQTFEVNEMHLRFGQCRALITFPPFHMGGLIYTISSNIWVDSTIVLPPPVPPTGDIINAIHVVAGVQHSMLVPSIVIELSKNEDHLANLSKLRGVTYAGGPLPEATGRLIAERVKLTSGYGTSETVTLAQLPKPAEDWPYFKFNETAGGLEFRERDRGLYELVFVRREEYDIAQPVFVTFPEITEWATKDLFSKGPKPGLWKYSSRLDDIIVLSNGEKVNPVTFENLVTTSPDVKGCVVVGQARFQCALLVEPNDDDEDKQQLIEKIWPFVQRSNEPAVKHGRVAKDLIIFTKPGKPLPRAGKGTIQRSSANRLYEAEVEELYSTLESARPKKNAKRIDLSDVETTKASLLAFMHDEAGLTELKVGDEFFSQGMDSLMLINLVRAINAARPNDAIDAKQVYDNSTIEKLSESLQKALPARYFDGYDSDDSLDRSAWMSMDNLYQDMTTRLAAESGNSVRHSKRKSATNFLRSTEGGPVYQPDGGSTAWLQVFACFLINVNNWGLVNAYGVFQEFYETNYLSSYSSSSIAWIGTLQGALLLIIGVVSGPLFDKGYFKAILVFSGIGLVFALMMLSLSTEYYQIMLTQGVLSGICSGLLYIPSVALVPIYFKHHRGLALGIATSGGSIGGVIYPIVFNRLLQQIGFGWAVRIIGFIALVTLGVAIVISKPIGPRARRNLIDVSALKDVYYVSYMGSAFLLYAAILVPFFLTPLFSTQSLGTSTDFSFYTLAILNAAQFFGRIIPAWSSDFHHKILGPELLLFVGEISAGILGFAWIAVHNVGGYIPWLIVYGFITGMGATLPAVVLPYICPNLAVYGTRVGMLYACAGVGFLISTPVASAANEDSGGFLGSQCWTGACCIAAGLLFGITAWEARQRRLLYEMGKRRARGRGTGEKGKPEPQKQSMFKRGLFKKSDGPAQTV